MTTIYDAITSCEGLSYEDAALAFSGMSKFDFDIMLLRELGTGRVRLRAGKLIREEDCSVSPAQGTL